MCQAWASFRSRPPRTDRVHYWLILTRAQAARVFLFTADQLSCQERHREFVMADDRIPASGTVRCRPMDDICHRAVALDEIEVCGRNVAQLVAQVSDDGHGLQKDLGHHDRRTVID